MTPALGSTTSFWVRVSNAQGAVSSSAATVTVPTVLPALGGVGANENGQLGDGSVWSRSRAVQVSLGVRSATTGGLHSLFLKTDDTLWAMGNDAEARLGLGYSYGGVYAAPQMVVGGVATVSAGNAHSMFVKTDGSLWATGGNGYGQLGTGNTEGVPGPVQIATGVAAVSAGGEHTLFIKTDGSLWAMGRNDSGQLGRGSTASANMPVQVAAGVVFVSAGTAHTLFVKADGTLWGMGNNSYGQLGTGAASYSPQTTAVQVATGVASASAGDDHSLFVKTDGTLWAMGGNDYGQLGDGSPLYQSSNDRVSPVQIATGVQSVSAGRNSTYFIKTDGSLWATGFNEYGRLGTGSFPSAGDWARSIPVQIATGATSVATGAGSQHMLFTGETCTVTFSLGSFGTRTGGGALVQQVLTSTAAAAPAFTVASGRAFSGWSGSFAAITANTTITAQYVVPTTPVITGQPSGQALAFGQPAVLTVSATGNAPLSYQWYRGEAGDTAAPVSGATGPLLVTPPLVASTRFWVKVSNAELSTASSAVSVTVASASPWALGAVGLNDHGQLGDGTFANRSVPAQIATEVVSISAGDSHSVFIKADGSLWTMGGNIAGQLGNNSIVDRNTPVQIAVDVAAASAGDAHTVFVKHDGTLWAAGYNLLGQLGDGTNAQRRVPVQIAAGVAAVDAGRYHTLFVKTDGSLWAMGHNTSGQLGIDSPDFQRLVAMPVDTGVVSVSAGGVHSLYLKANRSLWAMGEPSAFGGAQQSYLQSKPVQVATGVVSVSAGRAHSHFIKTDASLWSVGLGSYGQLGNGATAPAFTPVSIASGVSSVAAGVGHSLFIKTDGSLWAMGANNAGQLGDGTLTNRSTPMQAGTGVRAVAAGGSHTLFLGTTHTVVFDLGGRATREGGGALMQAVLDRAAATPPTLVVDAGWAFIGWDTEFSSVTGALTVSARYVVPSAPVILAPPSGISVRWDAPAALRVAATANAALRYQWYRGETGETASPVEGATGALLVIADLPATTRFWVRISNAGVLTDSPAATVTVLAPVGALSVQGTGANASGQLGDGTTIGRLAPVAAMAGARRVSAGAGHTLFIKDDASLWATGSNTSGQLGDGTSTNRNAPVQIASDVLAASAGFTHSVFIKADRSLWAMGALPLDSGGLQYASTPLKIATGVAAAQAGYGRTFFVKTDGSLWALGNNLDGALGEGTATYRATPVQISADVVAVSSGYTHTLFVKADGTLWAMGGNGYGQLGDGGTATRYTPIQIATGVAAIAAGWSHSAFIKTDASLWTMGGSQSGQIGYGAMNSTPHPTPTLVATEVTSVSVGDFYTLYIKTDGTMWASGNNSYGQYGNGTSAYRTTFGQVGSGIFRVECGANHTFLMKETAPLSFATWTATFGLAGGDAAIAADPDGDGVCNLLEYAFGTSPLIANAAAARPSLTAGLVGGQPGLILTHRRRKAAALTYVYQKSSDLGGWGTVAITPVVDHSDVDGDGLVERVTVSLPLGAEPRVFLRVSVSE